MRTRTILRFTSELPGFRGGGTMRRSCVVYEQLYESMICQIVNWIQLLPVSVQASKDDASCSMICKVISG